MYKERKMIMKLYGFIVANSDCELTPKEKMCKAELFASPTQRNADAYEAYISVYEEMKEYEKIDRDYTPRRLSKAAFLKLFADDKPAVIQGYDYHINVEPFEFDMTNSYRTEVFQKISHANFLALQPGDKVYIKAGDNFFLSTVENKPFYNADADEPGLELETSNGFADEFSVYTKV